MYLFNCPLLNFLSLRTGLSSATRPQNWLQWSLDTAYSRYERFEKPHSCLDLPAAGSRF